MLQEHIKVFAENLLEAILITRIENRQIVYANKAAIELLGYTSEEINGLFIFDLISKNELSKARDAVIKNKAEPYEIDILPKFGEPIPVRTSGSVLEGIDEKFRITNIVDLRKIKETEKLLFLQSKHAAMGELINMIAHQWRQPLSIISTTISGLRVKEEYGMLKPNELIETLDKTMNSITYLSKTLDEFRNFNSKKSDFECIILSSIIDNALSFNNIGIGTIKLKVEKNYNKLPPIRTLKNELLQSILTILKNSQDVFLERRIENPMLKICISESKNKQIISIIDNGGGIDECIIDKIFEPYFTTKHSSMGTGLGLYMAKTIIEDLCNGKLEIKSFDGGSEFLIILPK